MSGVKESDTGLSPPNLWDLNADRKRISEQALHVARCTKIFSFPDDPAPKYIISLKQMAKFVVELGKRVSPTDIEEAMRVGYLFSL